MITKSDLKIVSKTKPTDAQLDDLLFAWTVTKHVKSNAIVFAKDNSTVGIGAGQMSRVDAARIAVQKAADTAAHHGWDRPRTGGAVAASDAFFPFADGLLAAAEAGWRIVMLRYFNPVGAHESGRIGEDPRKACKLCCCWVCDVDASMCPKWDAHCVCDGSAKWAAERASCRARAPPVRSPAGSSSS